METGWVAHPAATPEANDPTNIATMNAKKIRTLTSRSASCGIPKTISLFRKGSSGNLTTSCRGKLGSGAIPINPNPWQTEQRRSALQRRQFDVEHVPVPLQCSHVTLLSLFHLCYTPVRTARKAISSVSAFILIQLIAKFVYTAL